MFFVCMFGDWQGLPVFNLASKRLHCGWLLLPLHLCLPPLMQVIILIPRHLARQR
jgi:hypothetical protein